MGKLSYEMNKKQLGQFFTTNSDYILQGMESLVRGKKVADPFAGGGDLLVWANKNGARSIIGYDVDDRYVDKEKIILNDSLLSAKEYDFVITNPPYLNVNKASKETKEKYFSKHKFEDLYQISLASIMNSEEGIFIVPINFLSAENSESIRKLFFSKFTIDFVNYFTYQVFPDTTYNVIAAYYRRKKPDEDEQISFSMRIFFQNGESQNKSITLQQKYGWAIGRQFIAPILNSPNQLGIYRFEERHILPGNKPATLAWVHIDKQCIKGVSDQTLDVLKHNILLLKAIDSGSQNGRIALEDLRDYGVDGLVSIPTSRHMVQLILPKFVLLQEQMELIKEFNRELNHLRDKTFSLFLTNYRDKNRKRIGFDFVYKMVNSIYYQKIHPAKALRPDFETISKVYA